MTESFIQKTLQDASDFAKETGMPKLVSIVKDVHKMSPQTFLMNGKSVYNGDRFLWSDPDRSYIFAGVGISHIFTTDNADGRFQDIEREWKRFNEQIVVHSISYPYGTGPLIVGGFSFDPNKQSTNLWNKFPSAKFVIPAFLYTVVNDQAYFTANVMVHPHKEVHDYIKEVEEAEKMLLNFTTIPEKSSSIMVNKHEIEPDKWKKTIQKATSAIKRDEFEKVVLARELRVTFDQELQLEQITDRLMAEQPTSYVFAIEQGENCFLGASPERLVRKVKDNVYSTCLAGSIRRGKDEEEDQALGEELLTDEKNLIEHDVVVHMIKEAMSEYCEWIESPSHPVLYKTKHIQHLYTPVEGEMKKDHTLLSLVEHLHPTPALGGYPKRTSVEFIRDVERLDRGWYAAPIGWMDVEGNGEFIVGIRSGLVQKNEASLFAGCGIVADSDPESEYDETNIKFNPMLSALGGATHDTH